MHVVAYHYVRDLPRTRFPKIKGLLIEDFRRQVEMLSQSFEMAGLEAALDLLGGRYHPRRDLCLLTFDDGLKDHYTDVMPFLAERRIPGIFGVITACIEEHRVATVHKNHFLMAHLPLDSYCTAVMEGMIEEGCSVEVDPIAAERSYPLDDPDTAALKYLINFLIEPSVRDGVLGRIFARYLGDESGFASRLYMNWDEVRQLQSAGMLIAGHSHEHNALSTQDHGALKADVERCRHLLDTRLRPQHLWPFSYPYGKANSYSRSVIARLQECGFVCGFDTERGPNTAGADLFQLHRVDCNGALRELAIESDAAPVR